MNDLPLSGIRIIDLSWIIAGPTATRFLATMGAEVIKIGSARRPGPSTRGAPFQAYNQSKLYGSLNISKSRGVELAKDIISISDVLIENFAYGVIERLGLSYEVIRKDNPNIIMIASSGTGHTGPDKEYVAYGSLLQYYTGWNSISGHPDKPPIKGGLWADPWVGMELAMVISAALSNRVITGQGQYIDFSMAEALTAAIPEALLDFQMNDRVKEPQGNSDDWLFPHGVYRCAGNDRWIAIVINTHTEWLSLCNVINRTDLGDNPEFIHPAGRMNHQSQINDAITKWTETANDYDAMRILQDAGIPAGPSLDIARVFANQQLRQGGYFKNIESSDGITREMPSLGWRFKEEKEPYLTGAPVLGQHNDYVFRELLGLTETEIELLIAEKIIY